MLLRLRWMGLGMILALCGSAVVVTRMVRMRERFTPANVRRVAAAASSDGLAWAAGRLRVSHSPQG
ncbi:MAG: hypothetical protein OES13_01485 [Acidimicrobiia bacterium]|nr:hypothetical protein [Acidimicrobiia bacterium]